MDKCQKAQLTGLPLVAVCIQQKLWILPPVICKVGAVSIFHTEQNCRHAEALGRNAKNCREMAGQNRTSLSYKIDVDIEEENLLILVLDVTQGSVQCNTIPNGLQPRNKPNLNNSYQNSKGAQIEKTQQMQL